MSGVSTDESAVRTKKTPKIDLFVFLKTEEEQTMRRQTKCAGVNERTGSACCP